MQQDKSEKNSKKQSLVQTNNRVDIVKNNFNHKEVNIKESSLLSKELQFIKEIFSLLATVITGLSIFFIIITSLMCWLYLSDIDAIALYLPSMGTFNSVGLLIVIALILTMLALGINLPSLLVLLITTLNYKDKKVFKILLIPYLLMPLLFVAWFVFSLVEWGTLLAIISSLVFLGLIFYCIFFIHSKKLGSNLWSYLENNMEGSNKQFNVISVVYVLFVLCVVSLFTLLLLNKLWINTIEGFFSYCIFILCIWFGYILGALYLWYMSKKDETYKVNKIYLISFIIMIVGAQLTIMPIKTKEQLFQSVGIYQKDPQTFLLLNNDIKSSVAENFFGNDQNKIFQEKNLFKAYSRYSLGDIRLLCKDYFAFYQANKSRKKNTLSGCYVFSPEEIRIIYSDEPI